MNFLTANEAFSLYPYASFVQKVTILCRAFECRTEHKEYIERGFKPLILTETGPHILHRPETVRHPGDAYTWRITMFPVVCGPVAPVESNTWKLCAIEGSQYAQTVYDLFYHPKLRLPIVTVDIPNVRRWFDTERRAGSKRGG